jgi:hypothetical protein
MSIAQVSPAARHGPPLAPHVPAPQLPPQHPAAVEHAAVWAAHIPAAQVPVAASQNSEQHAPARSQGWPFDAHPAGARQTVAPAASSPHRNEQQSPGPEQACPSARQASTGAHRPA